MAENNLWLDEEGRIIEKPSLDNKVVENSWRNSKLKNRLTTLGLVGIIGLGISGSYFAYKEISSPSVIFIPEPIDMKLLEEKSTDILLLPTKIVHTDGSVIEEGLFHY